MLCIACRGASPATAGQDSRSHGLSNLHCKGQHKVQMASVAQNFRQDMAGSPQPWGKVDPSLYAMYFTGQAVSSENWCSRCQSLDHMAVNCPANRKRPRRVGRRQGGSSPRNRAGSTTSSRASASSERTASSLTHVRSAKWRATGGRNAAARRLVKNIGKAGTPWTVYIAECVY